VCKVSKPYVNGLCKCLRWYTIFYVNSKSKKGHNSVQMLDRVTSSCLQVGVMMVNKCAKFQSHMSMDFVNVCGGSQSFT
jgi:Ni,Fe-hydrogenase I cytochrome b subunit